MRLCAGACGGVQGCHSGASERPQPRERSPPKPESASSSSALRTGASHLRRGIVIGELNHGPQPGVAGELEARRGMHLDCGIAAAGPLRRSIAAPREMARARGWTASGTRSRHPRPSDPRRSLCRPAALRPPKAERSARPCSESWSIQAAARCCAEERPAACRRQTERRS